MQKKIIKVMFDYCSSGLWDPRRELNLKSLLKKVHYLEPIIKQWIAKSSINDNCFICGKDKRYYLKMQEKKLNLIGYAISNILKKELKNRYIIIFQDTSAKKFLILDN